MRRGGWIALLVTFGLLFVCGCIGFSTYYGLRILYSSVAEGSTDLPTAESSINTPVVVHPTPISTSSTGVIQGQVAEAQDTLNAIKNTEIPLNDLQDVVRRLKGISGIPRTVAETNINLQVGSMDDFWVSNVDSNEYFRISATLQYVTDHVYFWIQDGVSFNSGEVQQLVEKFDQDLYPRTREFFGSEWTPGIDGDPHIYILYARGLGNRLAGYFSSVDEEHPLADEYSNAHELININADNIDLGQDYALGVLVHEYQHMIHWNRDRNEDTWVNEGLSELAVFLNGYPVGSDLSYIDDPDLQLNDWPDALESTSPHYGSAFLFLNYFLDRFGETAARELVGNPANGLAGVDQVLEQIDARDSQTGMVLNADDVFIDWVIASYLKDDRVSGGVYTYHNYPEAPQARNTETITDCKQNSINRDVHQYGVDYIRIRCEGDYLLKFEGSSQTQVVPADVFSGDYFLWSNRGDEADMILTRGFDFRQHQGPLTLTYWTWFDLEEDYDYAFIEVSEDGDSWEVLTTPSGTPENPSGNNYGWGYNGSSQGWVQERVDLSRFAGQEVQIRFEYITDSAANGEGMLLDDIAIPEIGYATGFEEGMDGWQSAGWIRMNNVLPQDYSLALILLGDTTDVSDIPLEEDRTAEISLRLNDDIDQAVLVVAGKTRYTRQKAAYRITILER